MREREESTGSLGEGSGGDIKEKDGRVKVEKREGRGRRREAEIYGKGGEERER